MASGERYFIGPNVRNKLTDLFTRVDGMPVGAGVGGTIAVRLQGMQAPSPGASIRAGTFTGAWNIGSSKVVTFSTAPTATVSATNMVWPLGDASSGQRTCLVGKDGTAWLLVQPNLTQLPGYSESGTHVLVIVSGNLRFVETTAC